MGLATFDFEGGSNGGTASNATAGTSAVIPGTGGTIRHQASAAVHGALGLELMTGTSGGCYVEFNDTVIDESATGTIRFPYRLPTSSLSGTPSILQANGASGGTTTVLRLQLTPTDVLQMQDNGSAHTITGPDLTAYMGTYIGIAVQFYTGTTTTNATTTVRVYASPTAAANDYIAEFSSTAGAWNLGGSSSTAWPLKLFRLGVNQAQTASRTVAIDHVRYIDSATWLDGTAVSGSVVMSGGGTLTASGSTQATQVSSSVAMIGAGTLTVDASKIVAPTVTMTGAGALAVTNPALTRPGAVTLAGGSALSAGGSGSGSATVLLAGGGTLKVVHERAAVALLAGGGTLSAVTSSNSRVVLVGMVAEEGAPTADSRVVLVGLLIRDQGELTLTLEAPTQVDPFELVTVVATVGGGISVGGISWLQLSGKTADVLDVVQLDSTTYRLRFYAPADENPGTISWRATIDGGVSADIVTAIWPADEFMSTPDGDWTPTCIFELVDDV